MDIFFIFKIAIICILIRLMDSAKEMVEELHTLGPDKCGRLNDYRRPQTEL